MAPKQTTVKPWSGRFGADTDSFVEDFTESVSFDRRLWRHDIEGSIAHARMLARVGVLTESECAQITSGLEAIRGEIEAGRFEWRQELEDVHMNIEAALSARIGEVGKKLHTARSRNDQVATDLRLYLRGEIDEIRASLRGLITVLADLAEREADTIMPGFTHMQVAQPVTFGHHMLAWCAMLQRDLQRLGDCRRRVDVLPLGAAALAGTGFPIDRQFTAQLLGFSKVAENSLDAVSDRDFAVEFCAAGALILMHLSRFSEELVLWMSTQFGFIDLDDTWCTGSSIMPQKKNPDVPELVRGKTGRVYGDLLALLTIMKGQPLAYNRDNQEDKPALFDCVDTVRACLRAYGGLVPGIRVRREVLRAAAARGLGTATDLADYLVDKGVPFRTAHAVVGRIVQFATEQGRDLAELKIEELRRFSEHIAADVFARLELQGSVNARDHIGGTAPAQVRQAVQRLRAWLDAHLNQE
ncbi:MAG: argininosuccinate lyase [Gammaproteobacteria bacterium]|nr:argininosuccinate lyase [Gammaproteobacteria bacterium]